jgi:argininosuccinate lyase
MSPSEEKPWAGRFAQPTRKAVEQFTESISFDVRLYAEDIEASMAHAAMLQRCGLLTADELRTITDALEEIRSQIEDGTFVVRHELEDIHMNIESALIERAGEAGGKLHTARSRNDQVATDARLWVRKAIAALTERIEQLQRALVEKASQYREQIVPGFTHLQHAQPLLLAHLLLAPVAMLERDKQRLADARTRVNVSPLGACALAGTTLQTDPAYAAELLGFEALFTNSVDAVSDRDFLVEFVFCLSVIAMHLSRISEEWVLWASPEFDFVDIDESYCTGSSIMPQKKNPDVLELVRGKTGRVYGHLMAVLTTMKGLPLAYNRDMQEDKEALFDASDTVSNALAIMTDMVSHTEFKGEQMEAACERGGLDATSLAEYLVSKGVPFREAHRMVGRIVRHTSAQGRSLAETPIEELRGQCEAVGDDVYAVLGARNCIDRYASHGSSSPAEVARQIAEWRSLLGISEGGNPPADE